MLYIFTTPKCQLQTPSKSFLHKKYLFILRLSTRFRSTIAIQMPLICFNSCIFLGFFANVSYTGTCSNYYCYDLWVCSIYYQSKYIYNVYIIKLVLHVIYAAVQCTDTWIIKTLQTVNIGENQITCRQKGVKVRSDVSAWYILIVVSLVLLSLLNKNLVCVRFKCKQ